MQMSKSIFREGLKRTYIMGIVFSAIAAGFGVFSLIRPNGESYAIMATMLISLIPLPVLVVSMRYLNNPAAIDFYSTLPISQGGIIGNFIKISQIYIWASFVLGIVPFFIKDAIKAEIILKVFGQSLLVTGIALIAIAVIRSALVQFFLTLAIVQLPKTLFSVLDEKFNELFINTGNSYYVVVSARTSDDAGRELATSIGSSIGIAVVGVILIYIGIKLIKYLRRMDVDNNTFIHRILNATTSAALGFCLFLIAAYVALQHLADSTFVSFHGEASSETVATYKLLGEINSLSSSFPWFSVILFVVLGLVVTLVLTIRNCRKKRKNTIDFSLSFSFLAAICATFIGISSTYYLDAVKQFDISQVDHIGVARHWPANVSGFQAYDWYEMYSEIEMFASSFHDTAIADDEEGVAIADLESTKSFYIAKNAIPLTRAVMTDNGNVYSNFCEGSLTKSITSLNYDNEDNFAVIRNETIINEIVDAANSNSRTLSSIIQSGNPVYSNYNGRYLIINIHMKDGSSYLRRIYLTENEQYRITNLLE